MKRPLRNEAGEVTGHLTVGIDLTACEEASEQLDLLYGELEHRLPSSSCSPPSKPS